MCLRIPREGDIYVAKYAYVQRSQVHTCLRSLEWGKGNKSSMNNHNLDLVNNLIELLNVE